ncbi:MAG: DegT/DnrJ/EryC1/StrS family aminotransferase [Pirellulales bacterium]|nr:DegT/DnrJ/EryC1/StrS family aminotransferase [Pirellulales bacterium]
MKIYRPDFPAAAPVPMDAGTTTGQQPLSAVPLLDIQRQHAPLRGEMAAALERVLDSGKYILGPECEHLERNLEAYLQTKHAVGCASGSDALLLALMALGIGPGDEVIVPSYTFFATASAVWRLGAMPVFVDIDPATYCLNPRHVQARLTRATKAIIPVHLFGQCADLQTLREVAAPHQIPLVEDAAQAIGAKFQGQSAGTIGEIGCFSFYPTKNLGGIGDGGMLTTNNDELAARLKLLRGHGMEPRYYHQVVGINSRLDSLQAAALNVKLPYLPHWVAHRAANAARYHEMFHDRGLDRVLGLPVTAAYGEHAWNQYVVRVPDGRRDALRQYLTQCKVGTEIYYPLALHEQACFRSLGYSAGSLPESERAARETLALPIFPELTTTEMQTVVYRIAEYFGVRRTAAPQPVAAPVPIPRPVFLDREPLQNAAAPAAYVQYVVNGSL